MSIIHHPNLMNYILNWNRGASSEDKLTSSELGFHWQNEVNSQAILLVHLKHGVTIA